MILNSVFGISGDDQRKSSCAIVGLLKMTSRSIDVYLIKSFIQSTNRLRVCPAALPAVAYDIRLTASRWANGGLIAYRESISLDGKVSQTID